MDDVLSIHSNDSSCSSDVYEVEKILEEREKIINRRTSKTIKYYKVKWVGYLKPTWEPEKNLINCQELFDDFIRRRKNLKENT